MRSQARPGGSSIHACRPRACSPILTFGWWGFVPEKLTRHGAPLDKLAAVNSAAALTDEQWELVGDLFAHTQPAGCAGPDPATRDGRGDPVHRPDRLPVALPARALRNLDGGLGPVATLAANGVRAAAMARLAAIVRLLHDRAPLPSMVMVDAPTVKGSRYDPTFQEAGGRSGRTIRHQADRRSSPRSWACRSPLAWTPLDPTTSPPPASSFGVPSDPLHVTK